MSLVESIKRLFLDNVDNAAAFAIQKIGIENIDAKKLTAIINRFGLEKKIPPNFAHALKDGVISKEEVAELAQLLVSRSIK